MIMKKMRRKLYLDIDGVLITTKHPQPAYHVVEFIRYIVNNFECYWLTTHCKGDASNVIRYLSSYFEPTIMQDLRTIKPTCWDSLKTEAIDFGSNFYWLDDNPLQVEKCVILQHGKLERLIEVDLSHEEELKRVFERLTTF